MMSDASEMLAAALEQMDGIIAGRLERCLTSHVLEEACASLHPPCFGALLVIGGILTVKLMSNLFSIQHKSHHLPKCNYCASLTNGHGSTAGDLVYQERLSRLESDKECLVLQVSVLTDQVEVQGEKIRDLDMCLEEHRMKLNATEELLQQELLSRSTLETQKLELLTEISSLKLKLATVDRDNRESCVSLQGLYQELSEMRLRMATVETEKLQQERSLKSTKVRAIYGLVLMGCFLIVWLICTSKISLRVLDFPQDRKIEELQQSLLRFRKVQDMVMSVQGQKGENLHTAGFAPQQPHLLKAFLWEVQRRLMRYSLHTVCLSLSTHTHTHTHTHTQTHTIKFTNGLLHISISTLLKRLSWVFVLSMCIDDLLFFQVEVDGDSKKNSPSAPSSIQPSPGENDSFGTRKSRSSFGRGFFKIRSGKRTASAPNLAEAERKRTEHLDLAGTSSPKPKEGEKFSPETKKKVKGIRKFLGIMRRSQSTSFNLDDAPESEFKRGGVRATAGPRLGWSHDLQRGNNNELDTPFARWSKEQVCMWLQDQGLGLYLNHAQQWIRSGQTLLNASQHDLEKELGIRHPLHRKKLQLALQALGSEEDDSMGKLDFNWVTRWLDDIGLPQYKSQFDEGRVDGRMLHFMTVDDLLGLKVGSVLHHLSIKRAIQVLRINHYEPNCLRRRPSNENNITPAEVSEWTNHRVMEWLRSVDLAEYAPNLRGSGVHGGLMVLEPRFNVESMALLLNIPPSKTLLRRHLATHFHLLIGGEAQRLKQECLENPDYTLLTATAKVKPRRLSFGGFGTLRRKRQEDSEEYVCPMDVQMPQSSSFHRGLPMYEDELDRLEQMEDSEGTVRQIGAFSEGINNLTSMLKEDELFKEISSDANESSA
uniref:PPFIA binding protein 1a n=1 Tax=Astyanax mexicanus TaxID=7994 RepID=A0A8B9HPU4_ASTMX